MIMAIFSYLTPGVSYYNKMCCEIIIDLGIESELYIQSISLVLK